MMTFPPIIIGLMRQLELRRKLMCISLHLVGLSLITQQPALVVSNELVYRKLMKLNRSKVHGPDGIPGGVLKENADLLAAPIADILNEGGE